jgi:hypothetical protein
MNEAGGRRILPFEGMIPADAYIWASYREDELLQNRLLAITQGGFDPRRGYYRTVGNSSVVKSTRIVKDVKLGSHAYVKGANKLKNLTICSSSEEPTQIGEGVELVNGIIGYSCHVFYGCKAVRFVLCDHSNLTYGARLIHSDLGENTTVSCCEILNNLIFPAHEQHHNNSFLTASLVLGQSNIAAGATIGSNHNSRSNDGEVRAGRGFWPGLCSSLKHSSRFASFTLLRRDDYPAELDIPLPFSLVLNNLTEGRLEILPAFWWLSDMYALERNSWKFTARDKRFRKIQNIEYEPLAPDSIEEIFTALGLLETWTLRSARRSGIEIKDGNEKSLLLEDDSDLSFEVFGEKIERSSRPVLILKCRKAYRAYAKMVLHYAVKNLLDYIDSSSVSNLKEIHLALGGRRETEWTNMGGQLVLDADLRTLLDNIRSGRFASWESIHAAYGVLWAEYPRNKQRHAYGSLLSLLGVGELTPAVWKSALDDAMKIQEYIRDAVRDSRRKDYENPFRRMTFRNDEEMAAVIGNIDDNVFVREVAHRTEVYRKRIGKARSLVL